jgi:threonine/homoserine/homoserine lactone efflux protein
MPLTSFFVATLALNLAPGPDMAGAARTLLESRDGRAWFQRASGAMLTALGLRLALAR